LNFNDSLNNGFIAALAVKEQEKTLTLSPSKPALHSNPRPQNSASIDSSSNLVTVESRQGIKVDEKLTKTKILGNMQSPSVLRRNQITFANTDS